jgi:serine/threonine-protein kinase
MGRYRLEELLGMGASAEVWRAHDERLDRPVAVKVLHPHLLPDAAARRRFRSEARAAAVLAHPGIVTVYDTDATPSRSVIVFELVDGETLAELLARHGRLAPAEAARIGAELADALQHAHERGVLHRDVKPGNVIVDRTGRARLVDFGIARLLQAEAAHLTAAGSITGTLRYMSPERLAGAEATPAADLYALGAVLHEMLTGGPPFHASTPVELVRAQATPPERLAAVPHPLAALVRQALEPDPKRRPPDGAAMASRLRAWMAGDERLTPASAAPKPAMVERDTTVAMAAAPPEASWRCGPGGGRAAGRCSAPASWPRRSPPASR